MNECKKCFGYLAECEEICGSCGHKQWKKIGGSKGAPKTTIVAPNYPPRGKSNIDVEIERIDDAINVIEIRVTYGGGGWQIIKLRSKADLKKLRNEINKKMNGI